MSTATVNSIAMADIATINGQTVPSGGSSGYATSNSGLLLWGLDGSPTKPIPQDQFVGGSVPLRYKVFDPGSDVIVKIDDTQAFMGILTDAGDLYTGGGSSTAFLGRSIQGATPASGMYLAATNVADFCANQYGFFVVKTDGTLWHTGGTNQWLSGVSTQYYSFAQYGTDTDWVSVASTKGYPYAVYATKGAPYSRYIYATGYNAYGATGQGTTSGRLYAWTRVKSAAATDFSESIAQISSGPRGTCAVVTDTGKFFAWGDNNYGHVGTGTSGQTSYATQVGTSMNWSKVFMGALAGFAINTNGEIYCSGLNSSYYSFTNGQFSSGLRAYVKIGNHTDIVDVVGLNYSTGYDSKWRGLLFKKTDGKWYYNAENGFGHFGSPALSAKTTATIVGDFTDPQYVDNPISSTATQGVAWVTCEAQNVANIPGILISVS
jgi:hypothetical protein